MKSLDLTVVVCTYNRSNALQILLDGFNNCDKPTLLTWELLIIDNNSPDNTQDLLNISLLKYPYLRFEKEINQGISYARNRGISEAKGEYLFFMDDDASPSSWFLTSIEAALKKYPDILCFGVKVLSHFPNKPDWFAIEGPYALKGILGIFDLGESERLLNSADPSPLGSGLLIEKELISTFGGFNVKLGVSGGTKYPGRSEDTDLVERLRASGISVYYLPHPLVNHYPDLRRYDLNKLKIMFIGSGLALARLPVNNCKVLFGAPRHLFRSLMEHLFLVCLHSARGNKSASVYHKTRYWLTLGTLIGYMGLDRWLD